MRHAGKARQAALKMLLTSFLLLAAILAAGYVGMVLGTIIVAAATGLVVVWLIFAGFVLYFFRCPRPTVPTGTHLVLAPGQGKVDVIDEIEVKELGGSRLKRVSIFLSVFDVHVQRAPCAGKVTQVKHTSGLFLNAMKAESATVNENVFIGFEPAAAPGETIGVRMIAGLIARRIIPWVAENDTVEAGELVSLIRFGSRVDVYLPAHYKIRVSLGERVTVGESIIAARE